MSTFDDDVVEVDFTEYVMKKEEEKRRNLYEMRRGRFDKLGWDENEDIVICELADISRIKNDEEALLKRWLQTKKIKKRYRYSYERFLFPSEEKLRECEKGVHIKCEFEREVYVSEILGTPINDRTLADWQDLRYLQNENKEKAWNKGEEVSSDCEEYFLDVLKKGKKYKRDKKVF
jgi:hypothetical protein